jgi:hypothetical protein
METIEEAAEKYSEELLQAKTIQPHEKSWIKAMFIWVAKFQAQRMYSEENMKLAFETGRNFQLTGENNFNELIEQFKKQRDGDN